MGARDGLFFLACVHPPACAVDAEFETQMHADQSR
jgi:CBS-domain-containing membrane protein